ncbi:MAG: Unknown protein [uncultured Sulfurovum sp.]|uniref:Uncharacterized protein n=1 Tax=uncultured Sulfurovum sp. TaxID=269237 RepID=A0A6S6TI43_9BACT|nr:MAG: Unknown protein [uncultured Sulfurovum sp.]
MLIVLIIGIGFLNADDIQNIEKLKAEKKVLELKLEAYTIKKKIIEMEMFFEKNRVEKEEKVERENALIQLKNDLRAKRRNSQRDNKPYKG